MESPLEHFFREGFINDTSFEPLKIVKLETVPVKGERVKINSKQVRYQSNVKMGEVIDY